MANIVEFLYRGNARSLIKTQNEIVANSGRMSAAMNKGFASTQRTLRTTSAAAAAVGSAMTKVGFAGAAGIGFAAKAAIDFQDEMKRAQTQAGATAGQVDQMSRAILRMGQAG